VAPSAKTQARLAGIDPAILREPGAAGDAARRSVLSGSRVAVINPGYEGKRFIYERAARELGVELVLVGDVGHWSQALVDEGVAARFFEVGCAGAPAPTAGRIRAALGPEAVALDGVATFWEDAVPATMRLADALSLPGSSPAAADAARSKQRTLDASRAAGLPTPGYAHLNGLSSLRDAAEKVGFPAVIKPVFGAEAMGCLRVNDLAELETEYPIISRMICPDLDPIFEQGTDLMLEEYLDGTEFDVDIVLANGACVFAAVSENWPTNEPYLSETGMHTPSAYPPECQAELIDLCVRTGQALGFRDAALHTEAKYTSRGPRLIEVNARIGGGRIADYHRMVRGVDLVEQVLLTAVGIPVAPSPYDEPAGGVAAVFVHAPRSGVLRHDRFLDHLAADPTVFQADVVAETGDQVTSHLDGFPTPIAEISVRGDDTPSAIAHVQAIVDALEIPIE
jgi:biotin carboxylase